MNWGKNAHLAFGQRGKTKPPTVVPDQRISPLLVFGVETGDLVGQRVAEVAHQPKLKSGQVATHRHHAARTDRAQPDHDDDR